MDLNKIVTEINEGRERSEACFVFSLWKDPTLFDDYKDININEDKTLIGDDSIFYYNLGKGLRNQGLNNIDIVSIDSYLAARPEVKKTFEQYGGYAELQKLKDLGNPDNTESYYDDIVKRNALIAIAKQNEAAFNDVKRFKNYSAEDVYETFDAINNAVNLKCTKESKIENLYVTNEDVEELESGAANGVSYYKAYPLLNYTTLGLPIGDITLISGHSGAGKSSFVFNMAIGIVRDGTPVGILANEMQIMAYKILLISAVLTDDLKYYKLTRKKLKRGGWNEEEKNMVIQAQEIINEKYADMFHFVKVFGNNTGVIIKHMKRLSRLKGVKVFFWDTLKSDDSLSDKMWQELLVSSRRIFNVVAKEQWSLVCTFQLALYTTNQRYLDAGCLSNSKQIKEVVSEHIMLRKLWSDEYTGEKYDCKAYKLDGKIKVMLTLDKDKTYIVAFIDKTRNDENAKCILYEWESVWNKWKELGYCNIINDHKGY